MKKRRAADSNSDKFTGLSKLIRPAIIGALALGLSGTLLETFTPTDSMVMEKNILGPAIVIGILLTPWVQLLVQLK
jgi:hypothetical protein